MFRRRRRESFNSFKVMLGYSVYTVVSVSAIQLRIPPHEFGNKECSLCGPRKTFMSLRNVRVTEESGERAFTALCSCEKKKQELVRTCMLFNQRINVFFPKSILYAGSTLRSTLFPVLGDVLGCTFVAGVQIETLRRNGMMSRQADDGFIEALKPKRPRRQHRGFDPSRSDQGASPLRVSSQRCAGEI